MVGATAVLSSLSDQSDPLAAGLGELFTPAGLAFVVALLDAVLRRDRARLTLVWTVVVPLVAVLETAAYLRLLLTGPDAYPSLMQLPQGEVRDLLLLWGVLVGLPVTTGTSISDGLRTLRGWQAALVERKRARHEE